MTEPLVVASNITRYFGAGSRGVIAVRDVSCVVNPGQHIAMVGPSGSGKSTLMHLLGGLDTPTSGTISWPALGPREGLRPQHVTDIFQGPSLLAALSVRENVCLPLILDGLHPRGALELADAMLARFDVADLAEKLPEEISGGQAQRVAIARAVAGRPKFVLADEPTGQLDSVTAAHVLASLLERLDQLGAAAIIATHDPRVAARLDTVWTMRDGQLLAAGKAPCSTVSG